MKINIEVSARHCHLSQQDLDKLFGLNYRLKILKPLSQPSQFAAKETIVLKTKDGEINNLRILGPVRQKTQIELALTDARKLGIKPPLRLSGDIAGSTGGVLIGPKGKIILKEGVIIALRHIHANPQIAQKLKLSTGKKCSVKTLGPRSVIFNNVSVRINKDFGFSMHIDTDEGNAGLIDGACNQGEIL